MFNLCTVLCWFVGLKDLSLFVNEVKRDHEAMQLISDIQNRFVS